jgi:hypothetical protein
MSNLEVANGATRVSNIEIGGQRRTQGFIDFLKSEQAAEKAREAQLLAPVLEENRKLAAAQKETWRKPLAELDTFGQRRLETSTPNLGLPTIDAAIFDDPDKSTEAGQAARETIAEFLKSMTSKSGWVLSQSAQAKLKRFVLAQTVVHTTAVTEHALWASLEWLVEGGCFADGEYGYDPALITVTQSEAEQTPQTMNDVLTSMDINSSEGAAALRKATDREWMQSLSPLVEQFWDFLRDTYAIVPQDSDAKYLFGRGGLFEQRGWAITPENLNSARRYMANSGHWVDAQGFAALSVQEVLDSRLAKSEIDRPTYLRECLRFERMGKLNRPVREAKGLFLN